MTYEPERADGRKLHYGAGRQPLDDIIEAGWAPEFYAGNILKYLRRDKERETSLEKAVWYWRALSALHYSGAASKVYDQLVSRLQPHEVTFLLSKS
jgi:hypothetical protein